MAKKPKVTAIEEGQIYVVCPGKSISSKGKTFVEGDEVSHLNFVNGVDDLSRHVVDHKTLKLKK